MPSIVTSLNYIKKLSALRLGYYFDAFADYKTQLLSPKGLRMQQGFDIQKSEITKAIELSIQFLEHKQEDKGGYKGFLLYPGAATSWLSAHLAFVLEDYHETESIRKKIGFFLSTTGCEDGGWGYNRRVGVDLDSTAQALLTLNKLKIPFPDFLIGYILDAQSPEGGFPTYKPSPNNPLNNWQKPHPDITLMVIELLKRVGGFEKERALATEWLKTQTVEGIINNYWWDTPAYSIWLQDKVGFLQGISSNLVLKYSHAHPNLPNLGMLLPSMISMKTDIETVEKFCYLLLKTQLIDGSWACAPCLKVPHYSSPSSTVVYADNRRIFSTIHALNALFKLRNFLLDGNYSSTPSF